MLHSTFYCVLENAKVIVSSTNQEVSHRLNLTRPLLPHTSQPNTKNIFWNYCAFFVNLTSYKIF
jgi:hypothetical protein